MDNQTTKEAPLHLFLTDDPKQQHKVVVYDFKRPDKFSHDQVKTITIMHETFARLATSTVSTFLRQLVDFHVAKVDQLPFEEFMHAIPNPTTLAVINMDPLRGSMILEMDPFVTFFIIDRAFGGKGESSNTPHDLTDIECGLMEETAIRMLSNLREAFSTVLDLRPRLATIETNPQFAQIVPPTEMVCIVTIEVSMGESKGWINLCYPFLTLEPIVDKLSAAYWYASVRFDPDVQLAKAAAAIQMDAAVYYQGEKFSPAAVSKLKKGALVKLTGYAEGTAYLENGGATVIKLKRVRARRLTFVTAKPAGEALPLVPANKDTAEKQLKSLLTEFSQSLSAQMKASIGGLHAEIGQLRRKQDELAEQLYFDAAGSHAAETNGASDKPFSFITPARLDALCSFIFEEHPQTVTMIIAYLPAELAGQLLSRFALEKQLAVTRRLASLDRVAPETLRICETILRKKIESLSTESYQAAGGIQSVVKILNTAPRNLERNIIEALEQSNGELAESIKQNMFVFEDVVMLDKKAAHKLIQALDKETLAVALMKTIPEVIAYFDALLTKEEQLALKQIQEVKSPLRVDDIEVRQQQIVFKIRELETRGEILVARIGEAVV